MNYKYIKKDILWALAISVVLLLVGQPLTIGIIWPITIFIATLVLNKTSMQKGNLGKLIAIGRILTLQNSILLLGSMYYLIQNLSSNLLDIFFLIFSTAPIGLVMMIVLYSMFNSWSIKLAKNEILDLKSYKKQILVICVVLLIFAINLWNIFSQ